jgi:hypothetical protein
VCNLLTNICTVIFNVVEFLCMKEISSFHSHNFLWNWFHLMQIYIWHPLSHRGARIAQLVQWLGYRLDDRGIMVQFLLRGERFFFSLQRPNQLWGPSSLLSKGYGSFLRWSRWEGRKLITYSPILPRVRKCGAIPLLPHVSSWCGA